MKPLIAIKEKLRLPEDSANTSDHDNLPVDADKADWTRRSFFGVLPSWALCLSNWTIGSTLLSLGLTVWQALMCTAIALSITTMLDIIAGHIGTRHRITEPIACRLSFGITGSTLLVAVFGLFTMIWYSVQLFFGSQCLRVVIGAIAPQFLTIEDNLGSEALATDDLISLLLFWAILLVLHWWNIDMIRKIAREAVLVVLATMLSIVITCLVKAKGVGPLFSRPYEVIGVSEPPRGAELGWTLCLAISIVLSVNCTWFMPNFTRFSKNTWDAVPAICFTSCVCFTTILFGILSASAVDAIYPEDGLIWTPWGILAAFQRHGGSGARAAAFFGGIFLAYAQVSMNVLNNGYGCGLRFSALFPRWISVRRGTYITALPALAICPWELPNNPRVFSIWANINGVIAGPATGIFLLGDYLLVRKTKVHVPDLYVKGHGLYWYGNGTNWRAVLALFMSIWPMIPGLVKFSNPSADLSIGWLRLYQLSFPLGCVMAGLLHYVLFLVFPYPICQTSIRGAGEDRIVDKALKRTPEEKGNA